MAQAPKIAQLFEEFFQLVVLRGTGEARDHAPWYHGRQLQEEADDTFHPLLSGPARRSSSCFR